MRLNKKCILSLGSPSKCSFTQSKLRFFRLRKPKTTSFYSTSYHICININTYIYYFIYIYEYIYIVYQPQPGIGLK